MDVEFEDIDVHLRRLGKANGFALHPLEVRAKVEVFALDVLGAVFSDVVLGRRQSFLVAFPSVGVKPPHLATSQFVRQFSAVGVGAAPHHKSRNVTGVTIQAIPQPELLFFALHVAPHLIHFQG